MKQARRVGVVGLIGLMVMSRVWADSFPSSGFTYVLESRAGSATAQKCGFEMTTNCCSPVRAHYRQLETWTTIGFSRFCSMDCSSCGWNGTYSDHTIQRLTAPSCEITNLLCEGSFAFDEDGTYQGSGTRDCDGWTVVYTSVYGSATNHYDTLPHPDASWAGVYFWGDIDYDSWWWWSWNTHYTNCNESLCTSIMACEYWWSDGNLDGTNVVRSLYSDEFTTADLVASLTNSLDTEWKPCGDASPHATAEISEDETVATGTAVQVRFKVFARPGEKWEIEYFSWRKSAPTNAAVCVATNELRGIGTGGWEYVVVDVPAAFSTYTTNGCVRYLGEEAWITVGCGSGAGCASCDRAPGSVDATLGSVHVSMGLGASATGKGAGALLLAASFPSEALGTPAVLEPAGDLEGGEVLRDSSGFLRQVRATLCLADIVSLSPTNYVVSFYASSQLGGMDTNGFYDTSGLTPFSTCTVARMESTNHLRVTAENGASQVYDYTWSDADQGWTLVSGGGLRSETQSWDASGLTLTKTIRNAGAQLIRQETLTYVDLSGLGQVPVRRVLGTGAEARTNHWFYHDNPATDGTNYGKVRLEIEPSGFWRRYEYTTNGLLTKEVSQFMNAATNAADSQCRVVEYDHTSLTTNALASERRIEKLLGQEIGRQYTLELPGERRSIQCQSAGAAWNNESNLVTVTTLATTPGFEDRPASVLHPDGTMDVYTYEASGNQRTVTIASGIPDGSGTSIVDGTRTVTTTGNTGELLYRNVYSLSPDWDELLVDSDWYVYSDLNQSHTVHHLDGTTELVQSGCCGLELTQDRAGTLTHYYVDALKRPTATRHADIITSNVLDAAGNELATFRIGTNGTLVTLSQSAFDTAGRLTASTNALTGVTSYAETRNGAGETVRTITYPDTGTRIETDYPDGTRKSVTGTAVFPVRYEYGVTNDGGVWRAYTREIKLNTNGTDTAEWTLSYTDMLGRVCKTVYAAASGSPTSQSHYNTLGQLWKAVDPDGVVTLYAYNDKGEMEYTCLDSNRNGVIDLGGQDRITRTINEVTNYTDLWGSATVRRTLTYQWTETGPVLVNERLATVDGLRTASISHGQTHQMQTVYQGNGARQVTATAPDATFSVSQYQDGRLISTIWHDAWWNPLQAVSNTYDAHGRRDSVTDARNGTALLGYNAADLVTTNISPDPDGAGPGQPQETITHYNTSLRAWRVVQPDNTSVTNEYFATGLLKKTRGSRTYPVEYTYDSAGRLQTMKTWTNAATGTGAAVTTWVYDAYRGWLAKKVYQGETDNTADYEYLPSGRLWKRHWERGISTTYGYNGAGDLASADYSDATPDAAYGYDRRGRQTTVTNGGALWINRTFNDAGNLLTESYAAGPLAGLSVSNSYDAFLRRTNFTLLSGATPLRSVAYGYDPSAGRLETVAEGNAQAVYSYVANSPLVQQIAFKHNGVQRMTTTRHYDQLNRLTNTVSSAGGSNVVSFAYSYNSANQRTSVTNADGSYWTYTYDALGQVTAGKRYWSDGTSVAGHQFEYAFDDIGNRESATRDDRQSDYSANLLNQYESRTVPGYVNILGSATNTATVTVNLQATSRKGDYFRAELQVSNSAPLWLGVTNIAVLQQGTNADVVATNIGHLLIPQTPEAFTHDADGNLTSDSLWTNTWNAENQRTLIESRANVPVGGRAREQWTHLPDGRWIERIVSTNNGSVYIPAFTNRYVWDGNVLLAVLDAAGNVLQAYTRGLDLSGSHQGAGGVGGLLWVSAGTNGTHFACFDGNGNVMALVDASTGEDSARYEYGPFSEDIRATGPMARINSLRFSTQYADDITGDRKYLHRDLDAITGRWPNRDPIEEEGGLSLYSFVDNDSINFVDNLGLVATVSCVSQGKTYIDGHVFGYIRYGDESGFRDNTPNAWYWQTAEETHCPGGLCNSGGTQDEGSSSFVRAFIRNNTRCTLDVECSCRVSYVGSTDIPKSATNMKPKRLGGFTVKGHVLDKEIYRQVDPEDIGTAWVAIGAGNETHVKSFTLGPFGTKYLYHGNIIVAIGPSLKGAKFSERMEGDCVCFVEEK